MSTLYLTLPGTTLAARSEQLVVHAGRQTRRRVPVLGLERVAVLAPAHLTSHALALCARSGVELVVVGRRCGTLVRLGASEAGLRLRAAQCRAAENADFCLSWARSIVQGKIRNQRRLLVRSRAGREPALQAAREGLTAALERSEGASSSDSLRGLEGTASAAYFAGLGALLNPEYGFRGRNRRPPRDPANALLSFAYTLLTAEATAAVAAEGLEPALGFFHLPRSGRSALALDLVEEFRAPVADALVVQVTSRRMVRPGEFRTGDRGCRMSLEARRRFIAAYETKMTSPFADRSGTQTTLRDALRAQAARMAECILNGTAYTPFELP